MANYSRTFSMLAVKTGEVENRIFSSRLEAGRKHTHELAENIPADGVSHAGALPKGLT